MNAPNPVSLKTSPRLSRGSCLYFQDDFGAIFRVQLPISAGELSFVLITAKEQLIEN